MTTTTVDLDAYAAERVRNRPVPPAEQIERLRALLPPVRDKAVAA